MCTFTGFHLLRNRYLSNVPGDVIQQSLSSSWSACLQCARHVFITSQKCNPAAHQMHHAENNAATFRMSHLTNHAFSSPVSDLPISNDSPMSSVVSTFFSIFHHVLWWYIQKELTVSFRTLPGKSQRGTGLVHRDHPPTQDLEICFLCRGWLRVCHGHGWGLSQSGSGLWCLLCYTPCRCAYLGFRISGEHWYGV